MKKILLDRRQIERIKNKEYFITFNIGLNCNLNCTWCSRFAQYFDKSSRVSFENFKADFDYVKSLKDFKNVKTIVLENELFAHPDFMLFLSYIRQFYSNTIYVLTNGVWLFSASDNELKILKDLQVELHITKYVNSKINYDKIEEKLNKLSIFFEYYKEDFAPDIFKKYFIKTKFSTDYIKNKFRRSNCCCAYPVIRNGNIYFCPDAYARFQLSKKLKLNIQFKEGIDYKKLSSFDNIHDMHSWMLNYMSNSNLCRTCINSQEQELWSNRRIPFEYRLLTPEEKDLYCDM